MPAPRLKILIVDDVRENLRVLAQILRPYYQVLYAANGPDAITIARANAPPALILLDIMMPGMDGFQVCENLKKHLETKDIPIIFVTGATDDKTLKKAFDAGAADFVRKPVNRIELLSRIKSAIVQRRLNARIIGEEKLKTVIETAGGICHEMNQPIQAIASYTELLLMKLPETQPCRQYAAVVRDQIEIMGNITKKLMRITDYETREYLGKVKIIDIGKTSKKKRK